MSKSSDPLEAICKKAMAYPGSIKGESCNQFSFKASKGKFLFIGPGPKDQGYKALFKLDKSIAQAKSLAEKYPGHYKVGSSGGWVTVRFSDEKPFPKSIWEKWLNESYKLSCK